MFPALGLAEPLPFLIGMERGLLAAQERDSATTLSVFHQSLPDRFSNLNIRLHHDRYRDVTAAEFVGSEARALLHR